MPSPVMPVTLLPRICTTPAATNGKASEMPVELEMFAVMVLPLTTTPLAFWPE